MTDLAISSPGDNSCHLPDDTESHCLILMGFKMARGKCAAERQAQYRKRLRLKSIDIGLEALEFLQELRHRSGATSLEVLEAALAMAYVSDDPMWQVDGKSARQAVVAQAGKAEFAALEDELAKRLVTRHLRSQMPRRSHVCGAIGVPRPMIVSEAEFRMLPAELRCHMCADKIWRDYPLAERFSRDSLAVSEAAARARGETVIEGMLCLSGTPTVFMKRERRPRGR